MLLYSAPCLERCKLSLSHATICANVSHYYGCVGEKKKVCHMVEACLALHVMLHSNPGVSKTQPCSCDRQLGVI